MKVLFFAPHAALWVHAFPEALIAECLAQAGHEIVYVTCGGQFSRYCVPMIARGLSPHAGPADKKRVCVACKANKSLIRQQFGFRSYDLDSMLDSDDLTEIDRRLENTGPKNFLDLVIDGVEVGRAALGTYLLVHKKSSLDFDDDEWKIFRLELINTLYAFYASRRILRTERPDRTIVYSSGYSVNLVFCHVAASLGITHYYMNAGSNITDRLQKVVLARGHSLQKRLLTYWPDFRQKPCPGKAMRYATDHFIEVLKGRSSFVYSSARLGERVDIRQKFQVRPHQKILLATMSSYDEIFAASTIGLFPSNYETPFPDQVSWLRTLLSWIAGRPELFLIIRVHPREFPNKRDSVKSEHAYRLEGELKDLPRNAAVNWPSDGLSLYDLAEVTSVCLNAWSSVGKEMSLLGIPTVIYSPDLVFYPKDLNYVGTTPAEYFRAIETALREGWSIEKIRLTYRWLALEDVFSRLDISDGFRRSEHPIPSLAKRAIGKLRRRINPLWREEADCRGRAARLRVSPLVEEILAKEQYSVMDVLTPNDFESVSESEETHLLKTEVRRLAKALYVDLDGPAAPETLKANIQEYLHGRRLITESGQPKETAQST